MKITLSSWQWIAGFLLISLREAFLTITLLKSNLSNWILNWSHPLGAFVKESKEGFLSKKKFFQ